MSKIEQGKRTPEDVAITGQPINVDGGSAGVDPFTVDLPYYSGFEFGDYRNINRFGFNNDIDTGAAEDIWTSGGMFPYLTTARTLSIVSTSASDTAAAGTGARLVVVDGLNSAFVEQLEVVAMTGLVPVITALSYLRIDRIFVFTAGSTKFNVGMITATATVDLVVQATIPIVPTPLGTSFGAFYTIPAGKVGVFNDVHASLGGGGAATAVVRLFIRDAANPDGAWRAGFRFTLQATSSDRHHVLPLPALIPEMYDLRLSATVGQNNTEVEAGFSLMTRDAP